MTPQAQKKLLFSNQNSNFRYSMKFSGNINLSESELTFQMSMSFNRVKVREGKFNEITSILAWYEFINDIILDHLDDEIKSTNKSGVWR